MSTKTFCHKHWNHTSVVNSDTDTLLWTVAVNFFSLKTPTNGLCCLSDIEHDTHTTDPSLTKLRQMKRFGERSNSPTVPTGTPHRTRSCPEGLRSEERGGKSVRLLLLGSGQAWPVTIATMKPLLGASRDHLTRNGLHTQWGHSFESSVCTVVVVG
jgi:hypothetical protein